MADALTGIVKELPFPTTEYHDRCRRLRQLMAEARLDVMLVHQPASVFYFSGNENLHVYDHECVVIPTQGEISLLVPEADLSRAHLTSWVSRIFSFSFADNPAHVLAEILEEQGLARAHIGVEKRVPRAACLSVHVYESLLAALPNASFVDASGLPERVKLVKSPQEVTYLRQAAGFTDAGMRAALATAAEGRTDNDVAAAAYQAMIGAGSEFLSIPAIVNAGRYSGISHSTHKRQRLERGDVLFLELGGCYQRYSAPCMRSATIGPPTDDAKRLAEGCLAALGEMHTVMRPGTTFDEVSRAGARGVAQAGSPVHWGGDCGYPVGAGFPPHWGEYSCQIALGDQTVLQPGMVFHQPIALRVLGKIGVAFSETVLITQTGCEALTRVERRLLVC
jgi:Xaa-Pro aminopeptidase